MKQLTQPGSYYTEDIKREAINLYAVYGVAAKVSRELDIPEPTICGWRKQGWWQSALEEVRSQNVDEHVANYHALVREGQRVALEKLPDASARDAAIIAATATDKARLLLNQPTSIKADTKSLEALAKRFEQLSSRNRVISTQDGDGNEVEV